MKVTSCPICTENFTPYTSFQGNKARSRQPLILKCGHTFCEICIAQKLKKSESHDWDSQITCYTCQKITIVENGIKDLPVNVYLTAFIGINQRAKLDLQLGQLGPASRLFTRAISETNPAKKCQMCQDKNCTCQCVECESFLCFKCFAKVHTISASIKEHKPVPIAAPQLPKVEASSTIACETTCADHSRPIEYFCQDDSSSICSRCYILGKHKNHSIISFEEKNKQVLSDIENELPNVTKVLKHLKSIDKKLVASLPNAKNETKAVIDQINQSFLNLHALLQTREMELIDSLTFAFKENCIELVEQKQMFQKQRVALEGAVRDAMKLIENNALVMDGNALLDVLQGARSIPCIIVKNDVLESESIHWEETNSSELIQAISSYGGFTGKVQQKIGFKTVEEAPEELDNADIVSVGSAASVSSFQSNGEVSVSSDISSAPDIPSAADSAGEDVLIEGDDIDPTTDKGKKQFKEPIDKLLVKGPQQHVMVTHIRSPNDFYVQLTSNKHKLTTLSHNINTWCRKKASVKHTPLVVEKHMYVLACYSVDKLWYRAQVLDVEMPSGQKGDEGLKVRVHYIDYGNEELVAVKDLRAMEKRFAIYPVFAVRCSLINFAPYADDKPWSLEAIQEFLKMTQHKVFLLSTFAKQGELHEVDLVTMPAENVQDDGFVSLRDVMIFLELGRFRTYSDAAKNIPLPPSYQKVDFIKPTALKSNRSVDVIVTSVTSPWDFFVVTTGIEQDYYLTMLEHMQQMYGEDISNIYSLFYPREGMVCSVKGENGKWYRGKVIGTAQVKQVTVKYVDTGLIEVVHIDRLKKLHSDFLKLPAQAINCKLADVHPIGSSDRIWSSEAEIWFQNMLTGTELCVQVIRSGDLPDVVLWLDKRNNVQKSSLSVNYKLVEMSFAQSTGSASTAVAQVALVDSSWAAELKDENALTKWDSLSQSNGAISHPAHPTLQLGLKTSDLSSVSNRTRGRKPHSSNPAEITPHNKIPCANALPSTQRPKRGKGIEINLEPKKSKEFIRKPPGSQKSRQVQSSSPGEATGNHTEKEKIQREIHRAMSSSEEPSSSDSPSSVYIEVLVINYKSPSDFFIRIQDKERQLEELMVDMQSIYSGLQNQAPHQWQVNDYCAARYSVDKLWYRCIIKKIIANEYEVEMVDFGYYDKVKESELQILKQDLGTRLECSAVRCHLADLIPAGSVDVTKWSCTAVEFMASQIKDKKLYIKQEGDLTDMGLPIDIIVEEVVPETAFDPAIRNYHSLRQNILKEGLAMPAKKSTNTTKDIDKDAGSFQKLIFEKSPRKFESSIKPSASPKTEVDYSCLAVSDSEEFDDSELLDLNETLKPLSFASGSEDIREYVPSATIVPQVPMLEVGSELLVIPTYVTADCDIYCQPELWVQQAVSLAENLLKLYGLWEPQLTKQPVTTWKIGDFCVSPFEDDLQWYRATITNIDKDSAQVFYFDFGNSAWVNLCDLRLMHPLLNNVHILSYKFGIHDIKLFPSSLWEPAVVRQISQQLLSFECFVKVKEVNVKENLILVDILRISDQLSLKDFIVNIGAATCCSDDRHLYAHSELIGRAVHSITDCLRPSMGNIGSSFRGVITNVERPDVIYLQRSLVDPCAATKESVAWNQRISQFEALMEDINKQTTASFKDMPTEEGFLLEGQYSVDSRWYRAIIVKAYPLNKVCMVTYFDFGTTEVLPHDRLRPIHTSIKHFPVMAWRCHLPILSPKKHGGKWTQQILHGINKVLFGQEVLVKIVKLKPRTVTLFDETSNKYLIQTLFELGLAQPDDTQSDAVSADVEDVESEQLCTVAGIKCHLTKSEEEEIEMIVSGRTTLPESAVDACEVEPFWNVGFESILNTEERKKMVEFLARKALSIKMIESKNKISGHYVATERDKETLNYPNVASKVLEVKTGEATSNVQTEVNADTDTCCDDDDDEWTSDEEETLSENDNQKFQNDAGK